VKNYSYRFSKIILYIFILFFSSAGILPVRQSGLYAQISPGELTTAHAKLEGISNCTKCHQLGKGVEESRCLNCHNEIKSLIDNGKGYHSSKEVKEKKCWNCHSEHHGRNFRIVVIDTGNFDHNKTGFALKAKHDSIKCKDCHQEKFIVDLPPGSQVKKNEQSYLGLSASCKSCHEDSHQGTLGDNCGNCHDTKSFKPAPLFSHNNAKYKLTGAHNKIECVKCHPKETREAKAFQKFVGLQFSNCTPCHQDVHKGKFGPGCQKCHITESFKIINEKIFDHDKTDYPLVGKHQSVKCQDCHKNGLEVKLKFQKCTDCHSDYHKGDFTVNNIVTDCSVCHKVQGFQPSLFTIEKHNKLKFQLTGRHLAASCENCHYINNEWHFKNVGEKCIDCHENVHGTELTSKFLPNNDCTNCHLTENWYTIKFDHSRTKFSLKGKHEKVTCGDCHHKENDMGIKEYIFVSLKSDCVTCHKDVHYGQFNQGNSSDCQSCHNFDDWRPAKFDHEKTKFSLKGAHEKVKCSACHKIVSRGGNVFIQYKLKDFKCAVCHS
jgi:nitrate/TMAO reductase-like tetraheme cytochrome c subunit